MMSEHKSALQKTVLFKDMDEEEYENLINCLSPQVKYYPKNNILLLTGDKINHIGVILNGTARAYYI